jgi:uncharacterized protein
LVHISALSDTFVKDPRDVVRVGQTVKVKVQEVDVGRKRIALTMRLNDESTRTRHNGDDRRGAAADRRSPNSAGAQRRNVGRAAAVAPGGAMAAAFARLKK